ncbi:hypothetical protein J2S13_001991 [Oikeobacillus pervagus]|uniref:Inner membrane protein YgaP-like transmembrane domain-containing protein n=1 Tax=Oikeobacillus pervagus TaxID=1325931 RepID=A0AAJ1SZ88_9BACI|nr:DUF2892 domain-containing protein [Oikeobacillus pervagus]MDQ0215573.1 hypothetical protein [Oikeobacillus pervagus]
MKVKPNIGIINALIRITLGLTILVWSTAKYSKRPTCDSYLLVALMGAMKVGEGILRYCPLTDVYKNQMETTNSQSEQTQSEESNLSINPS